MQPSKGSTGHSMWTTVPASSGRTRPRSMEISGSRCSASQGWSATKMSAAAGKGLRPGFVLGQPGLVGHEDVGGGGKGAEARLQFADFGLLGQEELLGEGLVVPGVISKMSWSDAAALSW